ncbi:MAG TPA: MarP family serine protease [Mycobacteriales bacterium]|nr:MarP family serine protease [Mycobacteriales bacterium]
MRGDLLDLILLGLILLSAVRGYRRGLLVGAGSLIGLIGGALLGTRVAGPIANAFTSGRAAAVLGLAVVVFFAVLLQEVLAHAAATARKAIRFTPLRTLDGIGGAALSVFALLFVAWVIGYAAERSPFTTLARQVQRSRILTAVDAIVPSHLYLDFSTYLRLFEQQGQSIFVGLTPPSAPPVPPPVNGAVPPAVLRAEAPSIVKIVALEPECSQQTEGSGFVYSGDHVLTNAHVVAGSREVHIVADGSGSGLDLPATVVLYDPNVDIAVLEVPGLSRHALAFAGRASTGDSAEAAGYPENGGFTATAARVRGEEPVSGPNIYDNRTVTRHVYVLRAQVRPGNSGGPVLAPDGRVYGVVFATSTTDPQTGYALTAAEVAADANAGATATSAVGTEGCT